PSSHHVVSPVSIERFISNCSREGFQGWGDEFVWDPGAFEPHPAGTTNGLGELGRPHVLPDQERARTIWLEAGGRVRYVALTEESTDVGVHFEELGYPVQFIHLEDHDRAIDVLTDEDQVEDTNRARVHQGLELRGDLP